jgi:hypothetical protein
MQKRRQPIVSLRLRHAVQVKLCIRHHFALAQAAQG